jgi:hypothetical protein
MADRTSAYRGFCGSMRARILWYKDRACSRSPFNSNSTARLNRGSRSASSFIPCATICAAARLQQSQRKSPSIFTTPFPPSCVHHTDGESFVVTSQSGRCYELGPGLQYRVWRPALMSRLSCYRRRGFFGRTNRASRLAATPKRAIERTPTQPPVVHRGAAAPAP